MVQLSTMNRRVAFIACLVIGMIIVFLGAILYFNQPIIPGDIRSQATFTIYASRDTIVRINKPTIKYDKTLKDLSFTAHYDQTTLTFSEQPSPSQFADIPDAYPRLIAGLGQYAQFEDQIGTIYLAKSAKLANKQVAVTNSKGTLMFIKSEKNLSEDQWKIIFNHLQLLN
jgi:hypothetical protein